MKTTICFLIGSIISVGLALAADKSVIAQSPDSATQAVIRIGKMSVERATHQATRLATGQVLITGGCAGRCSQVLSSVELFDPDTQTFTSVAEMATPRTGGEAIALPDGRVLVAGGWTGERVTASAEIYDSAAGRWSSAGEMRDARMSHMVVALPDGRVLVIGGETRPRRSLASAEVFDPATARFATTGSMHTPRAYPAAVGLSDGRVLVTGGHRARDEVVRSAEIFDPATGKFRIAGNMAVPRHKHAAVLLQDGRALIVGGSDERDGRGRLASTEFYDPETGEFSQGPTMHSPRHKIHDAVVVLPSGAVLVAGGSPHPEVWDPTEARFLQVRGRLEDRHEFATATLLPTGQVLLVGGYDASIQSLASAWLIRSMHEVVNYEDYH